MGAADVPVCMLETCYERCIGLRYASSMLLPRVAWLFTHMFEMLLSAFEDDDLPLIRFGPFKCFRCKDESQTC